MINMMWMWANNPLALIAGFWYQLRCCRKEGSLKKRFLPVILYLVAMAGCLLEGFVLSADPDGATVAILVCLFLGVHLVVAESAWLVYFIIRAFKKKKEEKFNKA